MRMVKILVVRDERLSIPCVLGAWEIPILQLIHGHEKVEVQDDYVRVSRDPPDAFAEFERLEKRYGEDEKTGDSWVSKAYAGARGIADLQAAIDASQDGAEVDPLS